MKKIKYMYLGKKATAVLLLMTMPFSQIALAQTAPSPDQLPVAGQVTAGQAIITQNGANMNIDQQSARAAIDWQSFNIGQNAQVNFNQPSASSVALNRVLSGDPSQIFGRLTANGQVFLTNAAGVYFARNATVNVGGFLATTHGISNDDFMAGRYHFNRDGATGAIINEGTMTADLSGYVALLAPEVRNEGVIVAQMGTVALAAGESYELQFNNQGSLVDITVTKSDIAGLIENKQAIEAPGGLIILSAQAANRLQGGVVKNSGIIEASGMIDDGGVVRLVASDAIELSGEIKADAAANSSGRGGKVTVIADLDNHESQMIFSGSVSAQGGTLGGDGGFVETSGSHLALNNTALVNTLATTGKTGEWLIDPYDYTINGAAATSIVNALALSNVTVTTAADDAAYGSNGNSGSTGNITISSAITSNSSNLLTLTAANTIDVSAAVSTGALTLTGTNGITLNNDLTTRTNMTLNGNITLGADVTLTSGISNTYTAYTSYTVAAGVTSVTATLVGGAGGRGGNDGGFQGGDTGSVGVLTAAFNVTPGDVLYVAPGSGGSTGVSSAGSAAGGAGGTNNFSLASGGAGGTAGPSGSSGGGGGGGAATILALTNTPTTASQMLIAGGAGGGGGSGNNATCPGICAGQSSNNYRTDGVMTGQTGYNATNQTPPTAGQDGGSSGGGGGGLAGGLSNISVFNTNEWTGRGGNVGSSGAANSFATTSLSTSLLSRSNNADGYAIISYGGGTVDINGTINGAKALSIVARSSDVDISGAIGGSTALTSFSVTGSTGIGLSGGAVTTTGAQSYTGPLTLNANTTTFTSSGNGDVTFAGDITKGSSVTSNLTVTNGSGSVAFNGQTGTSATPMGALSVTSTGTTSLAGAVYVTSLTKSGSGTTAISGGTVRTSGSQTYAGVVDISGSTTMSSTGTGNITYSGAISNSAQSNLTISAANGNVTLSGNLAVGTNARPTPIGDVSITANNGTVTLGSSGTPISADAKSLTISSTDANIYADGTTSFACGTGSNAVGICLTDTASFTVSSASTFSGPLAGTTSLTKAGSAKLTMTGNNTYSGNTTVSAGILEIGGSGKLGNGTYTGNISVTGQLRDNSSSNQTYSGTISGSGFINSPGSGTLNISTLSADNYNLATAYVVPTGSSGASTSSSSYGDTPTFSYQLATTAAGGTAITDASPSGTVVLGGKPTGTSNVGSYTVSYSSGLSLGSERYTLASGNNLSWTVNARPLTLTMNKTYDGLASFSSAAMSISGLVNSDATPTLSGSASTSSANAGSYTSFASSTLTQSNSNYTLTGATIDATITQKSLNLTVSKNFDGSTIFNKDFRLSGMVSGDSAPAVSGSAAVANPSSGDYTSFISNSLSLGNVNYKLTGGTILATILPETPQVQVPPTVVPTVPEINIEAPELVLPETTQPTVIPDNTTTKALLPVNDSNPPAVKDNNTGSTVQPTNTQSSNGGLPTQQNGVTVSLVQEPSAQSGGVVNVQVSQEVMTNTGGFLFVLPQGITSSGATGITVTKAGGEPLPSWIQFNPDTKTFTASNVPSGGLPLEVIVSIGGTQTKIIISENQ